MIPNLLDVDVNAWEAMRGGYQPTPPMDLSALIVDQRARHAEIVERMQKSLVRVGLTRLSRQFQADRAQWRPFFAQFDRSDARTWWRWRKRDRVARMRRRMDLDD